MNQIGNDNTQSWSETIYRKDRFLCVKCNKWHLDFDKLEWPGCKHLYGKQCAESLATQQQSIPTCCFHNCNKQMTLELDDSFTLGVTKLCVVCHQYFFNYSMIYWSNCNHLYCQDCAAHIINQSLSLLNEIPKCIYHQCNSLLTINYKGIINNKLLQKYQFKGDFRIYYREQCLIFGYIKNMKTQSIVPIEVMILIWDYYNTIYHKNTPCNTCHSNYRICIECNGQHQVMKLDCNYICNRQYLCGKCSNYFPNDSICYWSSCYHIFCRPCLLQYAKTETAQERIPKCCYLNSTCNQELNLISLKMAKNYIMNFVHMKNTGNIMLSLKDNSGRWQKVKIVEYKKPNTTITLGANINAQQKRYIYELQNYEAISVHFFQGFTQFSSRSDEWIFIKPNETICDCVDSFICGCYSPNKPQHILRCMSYEDDLLIKQLKVLLHKKYQFRCVKCAGWYCHDNCKFLWSTCNHMYCRQCAKTYIESKLDSDVLSTLTCVQLTCRNILKWKDATDICDIKACWQCNEYLPNEWIVQWSNCTHSYCDKCFHEFVEREITKKRIPICMDLECNEELTLDDFRNNFTEHDMLLKVENNKGKWYNAKIIKRTNKSIFVHYIGLDKKWDEWMSIKTNEIMCDETYMYTSEDKHRFIKTTKSVLIENAINLWHKKQRFLCTKCNLWHWNKNKFLWSSCEHKYGNKCAETHIYIQSSKQLFPTCCYENCDENIKFEDVLSFDIASKLKLCEKCNGHFVIKWLICWSNCDHLFCYECFVEIIKIDINKSRIPKCRNLYCNQEIRIQDLEKIKEQKTKEELKIIFYIKYGFVCSKCNDWHWNKDKFLWSKCKHKYGLKCVKQYIDKKISATKSKLNVFDKIPICFHKDCDEMIEFDDAMYVGITQFQQQKLKKMFVKRMK